MRCTRLVALTVLCGLLGFATSHQNRTRADEGKPGLPPAPLDSCDITATQAGIAKNGNVYISADVTFTTTGNNESLFCEIWNPYGGANGRWEAMPIILTNNTSLAIPTPMTGTVTFYKAIDPASAWADEIVTDRHVQTVRASLLNAQGVQVAGDTATAQYTPPPAVNHSDLRDD